MSAFQQNKLSRWTSCRYIYLNPKYLQVTPLGTSHLSDRSRAVLQDIRMKGTGTKAYGRPVLEDIVVVLLRVLNLVCGHVVRPFSESVAPPCESCTLAVPPGVQKLWHVHELARPKW